MNPAQATQDALSIFKERSKFPMVRNYVSSTGHLCVCQ